MKYTINEIKKLNNKLDSIVANKMKTVDFNEENESEHDNDFLKRIKNKQITSRNKANLIQIYDDVSFDIINC